MKLSKRDIQGQLKALGVAEGDVIFVSSDLIKVGYFNVNRAQTLRDWIDIFAAGCTINPVSLELSLKLDSIICGAFCCK